MRKARENLQQRRVYGSSRRNLFWPTDGQEATGHEALTVLADRGNFKGEEILACEGGGKRTAPCSNNGVVREE